MGQTMRTNNYRYTEWVKFIKAPNYKPDSNQTFAIEFYDHTKDAEENWNRAYDQSYVAVVNEASDLLHKGWRDALTDVE